MWVRVPLQAPFFMNSVSSVITSVISIAAEALRNPDNYVIYSSIRFYIRENIEHLLDYTSEIACEGLDICWHETT